MGSYDQQMTVDKPWEHGNIRSFSPSW